MSDCDNLAKLDRLQSMIAHPNIWQMSDLDIASIQMAVDVLQLLKKQRRMQLERDFDQHESVLSVTGHEFIGKNSLECFVKAAEAMREID